MTLERYIILQDGSEQQMSTGLLAASPSQVHPDTRNGMPARWSKGQHGVGGYREALCSWSTSFHQKLPALLYGTGELGRVPNDAVVVTLVPPLRLLHRHMES